jgi:hypothetical protein
MVDEESNKQNPRFVELVDFVKEWLNINKPNSTWRIWSNKPFSWLTEGSGVLDGYGQYFTIYKNYLTAGIGITRAGERYDTGFLIDATDPLFFDKLKVKLDEAETTYPERQAELLKSARAALDRMDKSSRGLGLSE